MLNEERVKLMTKLAAYESKEAGMNDIKISSYFQKDYTSFHVLSTLIWITIGYVLLAGAIGVAFMEKILQNLNVKMFILIAGGAVIGYVVLLLVYGIIAYYIARTRYNKARRSVKGYNLNLLRLNKMYEKEKK